MFFLFEKPYVDEFFLEVLPVEHARSRPVVCGFGISGTGARSKDRPRQEDYG